MITRCSVSSSPFSSAPAIIDAITSGDTDSTSPLVSTNCLLAAADAARSAVFCALYAPARIFAGAAAAAVEEEDEEDEGAHRDFRLTEGAAAGSLEMSLVAPLGLPKYRRELLATCVAAATAAADVVVTWGGVAPLRWHTVM